ncbi:MAG: hypothetical protein SCK70_15630 [bacterium]|nr:hypothetical protein [bacterium]
MGLRRRSYALGFTIYDLRLLIAPLLPKRLVGLVIFRLSNYDPPVVGQVCRSRQLADMVYD